MTCKLMLNMTYKLMLHITYKLMHLINATFLISLKYKEVHQKRFLEHVFCSYVISTDIIFPEI